MQKIIEKDNGDNKTVKRTHKGDRDTVVATTTVADRGGSGSGTLKTSGSRVVNEG